MPDEQQKLRVFLCHAKQDKPTVRELYKRLCAEGWIDPWLDEERLLPGQDWELEILKSIERADAVFLCLSMHSVTKEGYVQKEMKLALNVALSKPEDTIFVVPLRLNECEVPHSVLRYHYEDYFPDEHREHVYQRLLKSLRTRLQQRQSKETVSQPDDTKTWELRLSEEMTRYFQLVEVVEGNYKVAEGMIAYEARRHPELGRTALVQGILDRFARYGWQVDNGDATLKASRRGG